MSMRDTMSEGSPIQLRIYRAVPDETDAGLSVIPGVDVSEVMRYGGMMTARTPLPPAGDDEAAGEVRALIDECISEVLPVLTYKVCYRHVPVGWKDGLPVLPFEIFGSRNLAHSLEGCNEGVMFAATVGVGMDRLIQKYERISPSKALIMQALGAERVEALCDTFNADITAEAAARGLMTKPRFSPGYGDLPLKVQKEFTALLDCAHLIGINLNESMLMSPSKSVTAIIGMYRG